MTDRQYELHIRGSFDTDVLEQVSDLGIPGIARLGLLWPRGDKEMDTIVVRTTKLDEGGLKVVQRSLREGLPILRRRQQAVFTVVGEERIIRKRHGK